MNRPDEDLGRLAADALRIRHWMTRDVLHARPDEPAAELRAWMDASGFDIVPVDERPVQRLVRRARLEGFEGAASDIAEPIRLPHLVVDDLGLDAALPRLAAHGWFFVLAGEAVAGIVTRHDLRRPAVGQWVLAQLLVLERGLDHLLASYGGLRPSGDRPRSFHDVVEDLAACAPLRRDLGLTDAREVRDRLHAHRRLRNHLAHGRSVLDHAPTIEEAVEACTDAATFCAFVWALIDDREQIWDAYAASVLTTADGRPLPALAPGEGARHVLTACNPREHLLPAAENACRNRHLEALLRHRGAAFEPSRSAAADGGWEEPGFCVAGLTRAEALEVARRFGQRAIYEQTADALRVVDLAGRVRRERPL